MLTSSEIEQMQVVGSIILLLFWWNSTPGQSINAFSWLQASTTEQPYLSNTGNLPIPREPRWTFAFQTQLLHAQSWRKYSANAQYTSTHWAIGGVWTKSGNNEWASHNWKLATSIRMDESTVIGLAESADWIPGNTGNLWQFHLDFFSEITFGKFPVTLWFQDLAKNFDQTPYASSLRLNLFLGIPLSVNHELTLKSHSSSLATHHLALDYRLKFPKGWIHFQVSNIPSIDLGCHLHWESYVLMLNFRYHTVPQSFIMVGYAGQP